ncbi:hypothetical protein ABW20_dc0101308 [Dactylellina cionopaga]|nr:hypothetical protein ABW20_dc0101308 [Dactylellina cionopaga]
MKILLTCLTALLASFPAGAVPTTSGVSASQKCSPVPATATASGLVCKKTGDVNSAKRKSIRTFRSKSTPPGCDCITECFKDTTCLSYSYDQSKAECRLMRKSVVNQQFNPGNTNITWWDRSCWVVPTSCPQPSPSSTTTIKSTIIPLKCNRDMVLRTLMRAGAAATSFCQAPFAGVECVYMFDCVPGCGINIIDDYHDKANYS